MRNKPREVYNSDHNLRNKGIQCSECEGFRHIQSECAKTIKRKNKSLNATWSDGDSDYSKEDETNFITFASRSDNIGAEEISGSSSGPWGVKTLVYESSDDEKLMEEALI